MGLFDIFKNAMTKKENDNIDHIWNITDQDDFIIAMTDHICKKAQYGEDVSVLSESERIFYVTQTLEMEVNNGGFSQFFFNSSGDFSNEVVNAFNAIGAKATAAICQKAISVFGRDIPRDRDERDEMLEELENDGRADALEECDSEFFEYCDDLTKLNYDYVMKNKESFT